MAFVLHPMLRKIDKSAVEQAIDAAERRTSGEVRVSIAPFFWGNVEKMAERAFDRLGMTRTRYRNGVLFFVVPSRRRFVVLGDQGIHEKVGDEFWRAVVSHVAERFRVGDFTGGLVAGIREVGEQLAAHFPHEGDADVDELDNRVDEA